jgi:hypothetical protein
VGTATGADILFTAADGTTKLDHEIEKFASSSGELVAWVRLPFLSSTSTNEFFIYYGNSSQANQQNKTGVWDASFAGVWHLTTTSSQTTITYDSTANSNTGTKFATNQPFSSSTGTIDGAQDFDGDDDEINIPHDGRMDFVSGETITLSVWTRPGRIRGCDGWISNGGNWVIQMACNGTGDMLGFAFYSSGWKVFWSPATNPISTEQWYHIVLTHTFGNGASTRFYLNGELVGGSWVDGTGNESPSSSLNARIGDTTDEAYRGLLDEARVSRIARSASWIQTEYNNQSSPSTFYSILGEQKYGTQTSCTADDGATITGKDGLAAQVAFGSITQNTFYIACQDLEVSTNAGGGYSLATVENHTLQTSNGAQSIPDTTCNGGSCTESVAGTWTTNTVNGFGHTCRNQTGNDCVPAYSNGSYFRQFADMSSGETPQAVMSSTTPAIATGRIKYRINRSSTQVAGEYKNTVSFTLTGTY